jgi:predicted dinucleotide-binding enzyme
MSYAIVGFGKIGQALAHAFARKNINVTVASRRPPEALAPQARAIGPTVVAKSLRDALVRIADALCSCHVARGCS